MMDNIESDCGDFHLKHSKISKDLYRRQAPCGQASRRHAMLLSHYNENTTQKAHSEKKQFLAPGLSFVNTVMDTDEILEEIGSFGYFQKRNVPNCVHGVYRRGANMAVYSKQYGLHTKWNVQRR